MKMTVIWNVALCSLAEVHQFLEVLTAFIVRVMRKPYAGNWMDKVEPWPDHWGRGWGQGRQEERHPCTQLTHHPNNGGSKHL
jgi:hypothetical protein